MHWQEVPVIENVKDYKYSLSSYFKSSPENCCLRFIKQRINLPTIHLKINPRTCGFIFIKYKDYSIKQCLTINQRNCILQFALELFQDLSA